MAEYTLSASLEGHEDDVRDVAFPHPSFVLSASRDATVRTWKLTTSQPPTYDCTLSSHGSSFVNTLAFVPPSSKFPDGLIISGGKDAIIEAKAPGKTPQDNADAMLLGHSHNICSLDVSEDGNFIVSGSWDAEARIWEVGKWEATAVLTGHGGSVWSVLAYDKENIITGCADKLIRIFHPAGKLIRTIRGSSDVVRALCRMPQSHPSGANFVSAGNDSIIRLWTIKGVELGQLHGHESFIYAIAALPDGGIVSSSEDRTARIWRNGQCVQTITHPAISVWSVAVCPDNGDIVTGASDRIVRVFTKSPERRAEQATIAAFEDAVKSSAIPQQQVGDINKEQLPGPDFLTSKSGTKEGQVQMIKELNGNVAAYQWSTAANQWLLVGTVVDAAGSSGRKITHQGQDYDYVFDVDIEDGKPPLKLPYNLSQNPYEAATKFIENNELPISYLDQVANFIVSNTQGATLGQSNATNVPGSDPWGTESRYRPGEVGAPAPQNVSTASRPKVLPQTQYLSIATINLRMVEKKIREFNEALIEQGSKDLSLNPSDLDALSALCKQLETFKPNSTVPIVAGGIDVLVKIATQWPTDKRLPGLDLLRVSVAASDNTVTHTSSGGGTLVDILAGTGVFDPSSPVNNTMLSIRTFANLFQTEAGRLIADGEFEKIHSLIEPWLDNSATFSNRNLIVAITTLYINFSVLMTKPAHDADRALTLLSDLTKISSNVTDSEALYRALVGAGTLLSLGEDFRSAAKDAFDFLDVLDRAEKVGQEPRIKNVVAEMREELA